jgi:hypothetical protein
MKEKKKSVRFNTRVVYYVVPNNEQEDRAGYWIRDSQWFRARILRFEKMFKEVLIIK